MKKIICYRPGVVSNESAFECMALIYKYLQKTYGYQFVIVKSEDDAYVDNDFEVISIHRSLWMYIPDTYIMISSFRLKKTLFPIFKRADILLTVDPTVYPQGLFALKAASYFKIPVWFDTSMTIVGQGPSLLWKLTRPLLRKALYGATGIIATAPKCMERFQDLKLYDERIAVKFTMIGHPVDTEKFKPILKKSFKDGVLRILTVSRLVPEKGLYYILEAISLILSERNDVVWEIVGEGPMKPLLEQEARERNLSQKIRFCEKVPHDEVASVLGSADIFINHAVPTKRWEEYFGAVNIEAMACGLPCILSKTGGIPYAIREAGVCVMVDPRDVAQIRKALETLIANSGLRTKMGVRARKYVKDNYDIDLIADRFDRMICCRKHSRDIQGHEKDRNP